MVALARPLGFVFDEIWYAQNACRYVIGTAECGIDELASRAHPPLGNWLIGLGIKVLGYDEVGWRISAALAGTLTVALLYVLVRRLLRDIAPVAASVGAFAAAALLATDFLHLVLSRVGMLDVFVTGFVVASALFAVLDRDRLRRSAWGRSPTGWLSALTLGRPWRLLAGAALGAAVAVKWSGAYLAPGLLLLIAAWEISAHRRSADDGTVPPWRAAAWQAVREELPRSLILLGVVPVAVYVVVYIGRVPGDALALPWQEGTFWRNVWEHQSDMLSFHTTLAGSHPYESPPWSWLLLKRPVAFWFGTDGNAYREILAVGNPVTWWPGSAVLLGLGVWWLRRVDLRRPEPVLLVAALSAWLPWLVLSGSRTQVFLWYLLPAVPFLCAALGVLAARAWAAVAGRAAVAAYAAVVVASFVFFAPILTALPLEPDAWHARMLFTDCERPGAQTLELPSDDVSSGPPPDGWCWI